MIEARCCCRSSDARPWGLPELQWGSSGIRERLDEGFHSAEERRRAVRTGVCQRLSQRQRAATPILFRDLLLSIARQVSIQRNAA